MALVVFALALSFIISRSFPFAFATLQNVTIDDTYGDPVTGAKFTYSPVNHWSAQPGCSGCEATANATDAYNHTWHDTSFFPTKSPAPLNASVKFTGNITPSNDLVLEVDPLHCVYRVCGLCLLHHLPFFGESQWLHRLAVHDRWRN